MTKTYASTLTALHVLLLEIFSAAPAYSMIWPPRPTAVSGRWSDVKKMLPELVPVVAKFEHAFYFGAGNAFAASLEGALKMKEMALLHAEAAKPGKWLPARPRSSPRKPSARPCIPASRATLPPAVTARLAREWGARLLDVGPQPVAGDFHLPVAAQPYQAFASLALVPPLALLALPGCPGTRPKPKPTSLARALLFAGHDPYPGSFGKDFMEGQVQSLAYNLVSYANFWTQNDTNLDSALAMVETAIKLQPGNSYFLSQAAATNIKAGREAKALEIYGPAFAQKERGGYGGSQQLCELLGPPGQEPGRRSGGGQKSRRRPARGLLEMVDPSALVQEKMKNYPEAVKAKE